MYSEGSLSPYRSLEGSIQSNHNLSGLISAPRSCAAATPASLLFPVHTRHAPAFSVRLSLTTLFQSASCALPSCSQSSLYVFFSLTFYVIHIFMPVVHCQSFPSNVNAMKTRVFVDFVAVFKGLDLCCSGHILGAQ